MVSSRGEITLDFESREHLFVEFYSSNLEQLYEFLFDLAILKDATLIGYIAIVPLLTLRLWDNNTAHLRRIRLRKEEDRMLFKVRLNNCVDGRVPVLLQAIANILWFNPRDTHSRCEHIAILKGIEVVNRGKCITHCA